MKPGRSAATVGTQSQAGTKLIAAWPAAAASHRGKPPPHPRRRSQLGSPGPGPAIPFPTATRRLVPALLLLVAAVGSGANAAQATPPTEWLHRETLRYHLKWAALPVGEAVVTATQTNREDGRKQWHFSVTARTNSVIDTIYKVRDQVDAFADLELLRSFAFRQVQREGGYHRDFEVAFDHERRVAIRRRSGGSTKTIAIERNAYDPLTAFFALRPRRLEPHVSFSSPVSDGKKCVIAVVHVIARERIDIAAGSFDALLIQPDLGPVGGIIRKTPNAEIKLWVTDDDRHIPLKVESEVVVGRFTGELVALPPRLQGSGDEAAGPASEALGTAP